MPRKLRKEEDNPKASGSVPVPSPSVTITELTEWEKDRKPRTPITDETITNIQVRNLNIELTCAVCLGILHNTMTVMECLHRFCAGCISKSLRLGKKECPTCRVKCSSRRYLRPDPSFDAIINKIYPNLDEYEAKEDSLIEEINRNVMQSRTLTKSVEMGKRRQAMTKPFRTKVKEKRVPIKRKRKEQPKIDETQKPKGDELQKPKTEEPQKQKRVRAEDTEEEYINRNNNNNNSEIKSNNGEPEEKEKKKRKRDKEKYNGVEIGFILLCHSSEIKLEQLTNKYLRTSNLLTVRHLCKFLAKKFNEPDYKIFKITVGDQVLSEEATLQEIYDNYWKKPQDLILFYQLNQRA